MRQSSDADDFDAFARALQSAFPARNDAPLALARPLSEGRPVTAAALARAADRTEGEVAGRLSNWPNVERGETGHVVAFSGLALRPTAHEFSVGTRQLHYAGELAATDPPTCALRDTVADVRAALDGSRYGFCLVISERRILLGRVSRTAMEGADPMAPVESVMEPESSTVRFNTRARPRGAPGRQAPQDRHRHDAQWLPGRRLSPRRRRESSRPSRGGLEPRHPATGPIAT